MNILIYLIIIILFSVLLFWVWNNSKDFENIQSRIGFIVIGLISLTIITLIIFNISKIGVKYPNIDIMKDIRTISLLLYVPINGFLSLPHIANIQAKRAENEENTRKILILVIIWVISIIIEVKYLRNFQNGILQILSLK